MSMNIQTKEELIKLLLYNDDKGRIHNALHEDADITDFLLEEFRKEILQILSN
mgnify:CR=1 FL=1